MPVTPLLVRVQYRLTHRRGLIVEVPIFGSFPEWLKAVRVPVELVVPVIFSRTGV